MSHDEKFLLVDGNQTVKHLRKEREENHRRQRERTQTYHGLRKKYHVGGKIKKESGQNPATQESGVKVGWHAIP